MPLWLLLAGKYYITPLGSSFGDCRAIICHSPHHWLQVQSWPAQKTDLRTDFRSKAFEMWELESLLLGRQSRDTEKSFRWVITPILLHALSGVKLILAGKDRLGLTREGWVTVGKKGTCTDSEKGRRSLKEKRVCKVYWISPVSLRSHLYPSLYCSVLGGWPVCTTSTEVTYALASGCGWPRGALEGGRL